LAFTVFYADDSWVVERNEMRPLATHQAQILQMLTTGLAADSHPIIYSDASRQDCHIRTAVASEATPVHQREIMHHAENMPAESTTNRRPDRLQWQLSSSQIIAWAPRVHSEQNSADHLTRSDRTDGTDKATPQCRAAHGGRSQHMAM